VEFRILWYRRIRPDSRYSDGQWFTGLDIFNRRFMAFRFGYIMKSIAAYSRRV